MENDLYWQLQNAIDDLERIKLEIESIRSEAGKQWDNMTQEQKCNPDGMKLEYNNSFFYHTISHIEDAVSSLHNLQ